MSLGYSSQNALKDLLVAVGQGERNLENLRHRICSIYDFSPVSAFWRVDRRAAGSVNAHDLVDFLREQHNHSATFSECDQLVRFFDSDNDGVLNLAE